MKVSYLDKNDPIVQFLTQEVANLELESIKECPEINLTLYYNKDDFEILYGFVTPTYYRGFCNYYPIKFTTKPTYFSNE